MRCTTDSRRGLAFAKRDGGLSLVLVIDPMQAGCKAAVAEAAAPSTPLRHLWLVVAFCVQLELIVIISR